MQELFARFFVLGNEAIDNTIVHVASNNSYTADFEDFGGMLIVCKQRMNKKSRELSEDLRREIVSGTYINFLPTVFYYFFSTAYLLVFRFPVSIKGSELGNNRF